MNMLLNKEIQLDMDHHNTESAIADSVFNETFQNLMAVVPSGFERYTARAVYYASVKDGFHTMASAIVWKKMVKAMAEAMAYTIPFAMAQSIAKAVMMTPSHHDCFCYIVSEAMVNRNFYSPWPEGWPFRY